MKDFILEVSFDANDAALDDLVQSQLYLSASTGNSSVEVNGTIIVSGYFDSAEARDDAKRQLAGIAGIALHATDRERIDWLDRYQQSLKPLFIGRQFVVAPDAALIPSNATRHALVIPQEQAFGTGSHQTTALCIEILEALDIAGKRGLDVGAGSGILALAMCRLGVAHAVAFDNDADAFAALRDNRPRNAIEPARMPIFIGGLEALRGGLFDVVTMNIIPEVIIPLLGQVRRHVGGSLILSGILVVKRDDVVRACTAHDLVLIEERAKGEWWAGRFTLPRP